MTPCTWAGLGGLHINAPIVGIAAAGDRPGIRPRRRSDGGIYDYGVGFFGSVPGSLAAGQHLVAPIVGIAVTHSGSGYWEVGADGGVFNYGDAPFLGSVYTAIDGRPLTGRSSGSSTWDKPGRSHGTVTRLPRVGHRAVTCVPQ